MFQSVTSSEERQASSADDCGMKASLLESVNRRADSNETSTSAEHPGKRTGTDFNALQNAFFNFEKNPEALFGQARGSSNWFWNLPGESVNTFPGLNPLKKRSTPDGVFYQMDQKLAGTMSDADCRKACLRPMQAFSVELLQPLELFCKFAICEGKFHKH